MLEILIFSDSHGNALPMRRAIEAHPMAKYVLFCGDGVRDIAELEQAFPTKIFVSVKGNCDFFVSENDAPTERLFTLGGLTVLLTHGHLYGVKGGYGVAATYAARAGANLLIFGHTHHPIEGRMSVGDKSIHYFNPGSIGSGERSYGVLTVRENGYLFSHGTQAD